jgi:hypothetical protein
MRVLKHMRILFLTLLLFSASAFAQTANLSVSCTPPVQNTDGSPIPAGGTGSISKYTVSYGLCVSGALPATPTAIDSQICGTALTVAPGVWCAAVTATNTYGNASAFSLLVTKTILAPTPNAPSSIQVADTTIYQIEATKDKLALLPVGTVPGGTLCDAAQSVSGFLNLRVTPTNVVPLQGVSVTWYGNVRPQVVVAQCG